MKKLLLLIAAATLVSSTPGFAEDMKLGFVNFKNCLEKSKQGQQEKNAFEILKKNMQETLENTDKELSEIASKLEDQDYMDSLSPTSEEELKQKFHGLSSEFSRYQNQYYQLLNQANYKMFQSLHELVSSAAEKVREKCELSLILNEESTFSYAPALDITDIVIEEMDRLFDLENEEIAQLNRSGEFVR
ncbi:MAG: hypothetical protein S4CHLAM45_15240 [Chlamydiales bacterium]|nr:hypothetical protein [Chlamydiales bacterium]MCH9620141.1 hypothetical protein [Chlamydiales bacterium]MCH9623611.1 hypothetical protein [Chlamydiales bacterium]